MDQNHGLIQTFTNGEASSTIAAARVAVLHTTAGQCKLPSGADSIEKIAGVTTYPVAAGEEAALVMSGIVLLTIASAVTVRDEVVIADNAGRIKTKAAGATAQGLAVVGVALKTGTTLGNQIPVLLQIRNEYAS